MDAAVLIPIKAFSEAKGRLETVLDRGDRERVARFTAGRVVAAAHPLPTYVVCDDDAVAAWAVDVGAEVVWEISKGLNGAVDHAVDVLRSRGHDHVLVVHGDLPRPPAFARFARADTVTLVPDGRLDGTNLLSFPTDSGLRAAYGAGSFRRHLAAARATGRAVEVVHDRFLALDIDHPSDLLHPLIRPLLKEVLPTWLPTNPDNLPAHH